MELEVSGVHEQYVTKRITQRNFCVDISVVLQRKSCQSKLVQVKLLTVYGARTASDNLSHENVRRGGYRHFCHPWSSADSRAAQPPPLPHVSRYTATSKHHPPKTSTHPDIFTRNMNVIWRLFDSFSAYTKWFKWFLGTFATISW